MNAIGHRAPHVSTHIAEVAELPQEPEDHVEDRPDEPTPSLWQKSVKVTHKVSGRDAIVVRVDWYTNMFRAFYPDERNDKGELGRFATRREWEHCHDWHVKTTYSPSELARQAAVALLEQELAKLDAKDLALVQVLCDDPDPNKNYAKMMALRAAGLIKATPEVMAAAVEKGKK